MAINRTYDEAELLKRIAEGDEKAFSRLFHHYAFQLAGYVHSIIASRPLTQEILQDVFLKIWQNRSRLKTVEHFPDYLFIITRNHTLNALTKLATEIKRKKEYTNWVMTSQEAESVEERATYLPLIDKAIGQLPPQQQKAYLLSRREGLNNSEIAVMMGLDVSTVKRYIYLANQSIIKYLKENSSQFAVLYITLNFL